MEADVQNPGVSETGSTASKEDNSSSLDNESQHEHDEAGVLSADFQPKQHLTKSERKQKRYEEKIKWQKQQRKMLKDRRKLSGFQDTKQTVSDCLNESSAQPLAEGSNEESADVNHTLNQQPSDSSIGSLAATSTCNRLRKRDKLQLIKSRLLASKVNGQRICVDLSLEGFMSHKECSRLAQQLCRLYGSNRTAEHPAHVYLTGLKQSGSLYMECVRKNAGFENYIWDMTEKTHLDIFPLKDIVYLSPDSSQVLDIIDKDKVYVIGGLVDESVNKNITQSRAESAGIQTARLPIEEHMIRIPLGSYNKILAVNQVFDILITFIETGDWKRALSVGVPQRKGFTVNN